MKELVLDASVILKWFAANEAGVREAARLRDDYEAGSVMVTVPPLLFLELANVAGRRWKWTEDDLISFAAALGELGFEVAEPRLVNVAAWTAGGLTAYDATYVALAEERDLRLVTDDARILGVAAGVAIPLAG